MSMSLGERLMGERGESRQKQRGADSFDRKWVVWACARVWETALELALASTKLLCAQSSLRTLFLSLPCSPDN